jgi:hypothetical protein
LPGTGLSMNLLSASLPPSAVLFRALRRLSSVALVVFCVGTASVYAVSTAPAPTIFWASQPVRPAETVALAGEYFAPSTSVALMRLPDSDPGRPNVAQEASLPRFGQGAGWAKITPAMITDRNVEFALPPEKLAGVYAYAVQSDDGSSQTRLLNAPDPWFFQGDLGDTASPGGWIGVFGTCIGLSGTRSPLLALVSGNKTVAVVSARSSVDANGTYSLYVHNGHGGTAGWVHVQTYLKSPIDTITIRTSPAWSQKIFALGTETGADTDTRFASAIAKIKANGGGILAVPAGSYTLTKPLLLPNMTLLRGAGLRSTVLRWTADPSDQQGKPLPLVAGESYQNPDSNGDRRASFSLEDLAIVASPTYGGRAILRESSTMPSHFSRISVTVPRQGPDADAAAIQVSFTKNLQVNDCYLDARSDIYGYYRDIHYIRCTGNTLRWRSTPICLQRDHSHMIFEHNKEIMAGTWAGNGFTKAMNDNPGIWYAGYDSTNACDFYYAHNSSTREEADVPDGSIGMTFDGQTDTYCGKIAAVDGTHLTLAGPTHAADIYNHPPCVPGAAVCIIDGKGAGQWRWVTSTATTSATQIDIDKPWEVEPDSTSWIGITNYLGKAIFVDNDFGNDPLLQTYFGTHDVILAGNRIGVSGTKVNVVDWADAPMPGWHYQVLDNTIVKQGASMETALPAWATPKDYTGPVTGTIIYRDNQLAAPGMPFVIIAPARAAGIVIENNRGLTELNLAHADGTTGVVRRNADSSGSVPKSAPVASHLTLLP